MTAQTHDRYPAEVLDEYDDDGTMVTNVEDLASAVIGRRIVSFTEAQVQHKWYESLHEKAHVIELDDGTKVQLRGGGDCCAYTELRNFLLNVNLVDHIILGVGTTEGYERWHIYADAGDVLQLEVDWSCGNPFYYGYGFTIDVIRPDAA